MAGVTLDGNPFHTVGRASRRRGEGPRLPPRRGDLRDVTLATYRGRAKILNILPSLDTSVCATSARKFNEKAEALAGAVVLVVSADLRSR